MWDARPGMKVICVKGFPESKETNKPKEGCLYTLRDVDEKLCSGRNAVLPCCRLEEVVNTPVLCVDQHGISVQERWFVLSNFRPLNKNFSVFEEILKQPLKIKEKV